MNKSELITNRHLTRKAVIYIRQSTPQQQISNQESLRLQYALKQRALDFGWQEKEIEVIDSDLGRSGATANREGFKEMLAKVTLGEVGIILAWEVTRLSRNCTDWYPLLDICGYKGCLIADADGIYDPATPNGRMILGLKGQISELELHTIRTRMTAGLENKAARGDLVQHLPVGFVHQRDGKVYKNPDLEVQRRIELIFETFLKVGSANKVCHFFNENNLLLPRQDVDKKISWKIPSVPAILSTLKNPAYAGVFVRGKSQTVRCQSDPSKKSRKRLPIEQWRHVCKDKYPQYISWATYEKIQAKLRDNYTEYDRNKTRGVARGGANLLHGIAYCGKCGHKMVVQYKKGNQYLCNYFSQIYGVPMCERIPSDTVDAIVVKAFFEAASPIELNAYEKALEKQKQIEEKLDQAQRQKLQRLEYQTNLAQRQYDEADPSNRLVSAELEKRWETALWELKQAQEEYMKRKEKKDTTVLTPEMKDLFGNIGKKLPKIWNSDLLCRSKKKELLRALIEKVVMHRVGQDQVQIRIIWKGGEFSIFQTPVTVSAFYRLSSAKEMEETTILLSQQGKTDEEIAEHLTNLGHRSPKQDFVLISTIQTIRLKHGIMHTSYSHSKHVDGYLTVSQTAKKIGVVRHWIYGRIHNGTIKINKEPKTGLYLFPDNPHTIKKMKKLQSGKVRKLYFL